MPRAEAREGMATGDRGVARRAKPGLLRLSLSSPSSGCPAEERGELNCIPALLDDIGVEPKRFELLSWRLQPKVDRGIRLPRSLCL